MAIMLGVVLILCLWTRMGMGMDHRSAKGGLISNSSRIAIVGDCIAHYGALHTAGFARQLKHHLAHYHGGALVRSFYTPVNTATGLHGGLGDFYPSAFDTMMRDYQPTHVVAFFGTSDALAFLESHPDPTAMAGVGEGTLVRADLDVQRLVSGFKARLQNMAIRTHKEGAVLWLSTPSVLGEDVYSAPTPGQHLLELLAAAVRQVSEVMESPHFPHDMARHDQEEEKEKEEELRATQQAQGQGGKGSRGRKAAGKLSGARAKPPLRQVVEGVAAPAPRSALLDSHTALMKALEGVDRASLLRHRKHALTTDGVQLNTLGHNIVSEVLIRGLVWGGRPTAAAGTAGAMGSGLAETDLPLPPAFKERRAVPHMRASGETSPPPRPSAAAADESEPEPEPTIGEPQQQQEEEEQEEEHDSFLSEEDLALFDEL